MNKEEIKTIIKELIDKTNVSDNVVVTECVLDDELGGHCFSVELNNAHPFLSREGEALQALNHIVRRIVESKNPTSKTPNENIVVDINGFQKKKIETLKSLVHMMAERARYFKSSIELEPMSAYDRRIVHEILSLANDLKTESNGVGRDRRVVIRYVGQI